MYERRNEHTGTGRRGEKESRLFRASNDNLHALRVIAPATVPKNDDVVIKMRRDICIGSFGMMRAMWKTIREMVAVGSRSLLGLFAIALVTVSAIGIVVLMILVLTIESLPPYTGIFAFLVLPGVFIAGLLLIAVAVARNRRRGAGDGALPLRLDHRRIVILLSLTGINVIVLALSSYHAVEYMESPQFCGKVCHTVMEPEYTAYQNSSHSRVSCTECHIGPGASWFVKSKLSGLRQVAAVTLHTYPKPIPAPIANLRPARETCEKCHWPEKFHGDRIKVLRRYSEDAANTRQATVLLLKVGGGKPQSGFATGIHWHTMSHVEYRSSPDRRTIHWISVEDSTGAVREYWRGGDEARKDSILALPKRRMDCIDCHNRPSHEFELPAAALDAALEARRIPRDLPSVKREAMRLLQADYPSKQAALAGFEDSLRAFYGRTDPSLVTARAADITAAATALRAIYQRNVFPDMNVGWAVHPSMLGHQDDSGCFRCHDDGHRSSAGRTISQDCSTCHSVLAVEEPDPPVLQALYGP